MTYKIVMYVKRTNTYVTMPSDHDLSWEDAVYRQKLYAQKNKDCAFNIMPEEDAQ